MIAWQGGLTKTDVQVYERTFISGGENIWLVDSVNMTDAVEVVVSMVVLVAVSVAVFVVISIVVLIVSGEVSAGTDEHEKGGSEVRGPKKSKTKKGFSWIYHRLIATMVAEKFRTNDD